MQTRNLLNGYVALYVTVAGLLLGFTYQAGFLSYFGIPIEFASFSNSELFRIGLISLLLLAIVLGVDLIVGAMSEAWSKVTRVAAATVVTHSVILTLLIAAAILSIVFTPKETIVQSLLVLFAVIDLLLFLAMLFGNRKIVVARTLTDSDGNASAVPSNVLSTFLDNKHLINLVALILLVLGSAMLGRIEASQKTVFNAIQLDPSTGSDGSKGSDASSESSGWLAVRIDSDHAILTRYDLATKEWTHETRIIPLSTKSYVVMQRRPFSDSTNVKSAP